MIPKVYNVFFITFRIMYFLVLLYLQKVFCYTDTPYIIAKTNRCANAPWEDVEFIQEEDDELY
jgi:hypothetical protein